jgi:hypothetical protein
MRTPALLSFLLLGAVLAGCYKGPEEPVGYAGSMAPAADEVPSSFSLMPRDVVGKPLLEHYGMRQNPGTANPQNFSTPDGRHPVDAAGVVYRYLGDSNRAVVLFTLSFHSSGEAASFAQGFLKCEYHVAGKNVLQSANRLEVMGTIDSEGSELYGIANGVLAKVQQRTGGTLLCPPTPASA